MLKPDGTRIYASTHRAHDEWPGMPFSKTSTWADDSLHPYTLKWFLIGAAEWGFREHLGTYSSSALPLLSSHNLSWPLAFSWAQRHSTKTSFLTNKQAEQSCLLRHSLRASGHKDSSPSCCQNTSLKTQGHSKLHTSSRSYVWVSSAPQTQPRTEEFLWLLESLGDCSPWLAQLLVCCFIAGSLEEQVGGSLIVPFLSLVLHAHTDYVAIPRLSWAPPPPSHIPHLSLQVLQKSCLPNTKLLQQPHQEQYASMRYHL